MMKKIALLFLAFSLLGLTACNDDDNDFSFESSVTVPTLVSFAKLDVETYAVGPNSGAFVQGANNILPPFKGQPVQGFSGALKNGDGTYTVMTDNGFGAQDNSADFLLRLYQIKRDFRTKNSGSAKVQVMSFTQLSDPNKLIPFNIINQNTSDRLLTGADFDPESIQRATDGSYWIGDEFGPYLLHFNKEGVLLDAPISLPNPFKAGTELRSPQNQLNKANVNYVEPLVQQSGGFEGMALSKDGKYLYPLLEKPLKDSQVKQLIISQFDLEKKAYTGQYYLLNLNEKATAIGDFQMFDNNSGILIERDNSENNLEGYKKLIQVKLGESAQAIQRTELVDLMKLANPNNLYGTARADDIGTGATFAFPFFTIEDVIIENNQTLTVLNDNNFPSSFGRNKNHADNNEIIQIKLAKALF